MKLYISNSAEKCRNCFLNLSKFYILDVQQILGELNLDMSDKCNAFFVWKYADRFVSKVYINTNLSEKLCDNLFNCVKELPKMENMVLIDDPIFQPLSEFYPLFEEVMFFPTVRKVRILECQTLKPFDDDNRKEESDTLRMLKEAKKRREILIKHK